MSTETVTAMRQIVIRRWGAENTHVATVPADLIFSLTILGKAAEMLDGPVAARCTAILRGNLVVMSRAKVRCAACRRRTGITSTADLGGAV